MCRMQRAGVSASRSADLQSGGVLPGVLAFHGEGPEGGEHGRLRSQPENHEPCESLSVRLSTV